MQIIWIKFLIQPQNVKGFTLCMLYLPCKANKTPLEEEYEPTSSMAQG